MVDDWCYIVRSPNGSFGTARTPGGALHLSTMRNEMGLGPCTIEKTSPTMERAG